MIYKKNLQTDRWPNRAISPLPFDSDKDGLEVAIVLPGWGKRPETQTDLLMDLHHLGMWAIGLDMRFGYADQGSSILVPKMMVGDTNKYFDIQSSYQNQIELRRATAVLSACEDMGISEAVVIGHSEGGRTALKSAIAPCSPLEVKKLVLVNAVGTGTAAGPIGVVKANIRAVRDRSEINANNIEMVRSFRDSAGHFLTHSLRTWREANVMRGYNAWSDIDEFAKSPGMITLINALQDDLIDYDSALMQSLEYPNVEFISSEGGHSNVYGRAVRQLILSAL